MRRITKAVPKRLLRSDEEGAEFVVSTEAPDREGDRVSQDGLVWSEFDLAGAPATFNHDTDTIPVGRWEGRRRARITDPATGEEVDATIMRLVFNRNTAAGREVADSIADGFLNSASVSFLPSGHAPSNGHGGRDYHSAVVTEVAVCAVPANQGATRMAALCKRLKALSKDGGAQRYDDEMAEYLEERDLDGVRVDVPDDDEELDGGPVEKMSVADAGAWLADKWRWYENRYSRAGALSMALAMAATMPLPGNIPAVIAAAEAIRGLHGWAQGKGIDTDNVEDGIDAAAYRELAAECEEKAKDCEGGARYGLLQRAEQLRKLADEIVPEPDLSEEEQERLADAVARLEDAGEGLSKALYMATGKRFGDLNGRR